VLSREFGVSRVYPIGPRQRERSALEGGHVPEEREADAKNRLTFGQLLCSIREERSAYSTTDLSNSLGIPLDQVEAVEEGRLWPDDRVLEAYERISGDTDKSLQNLKQQLRKFPDGETARRLSRIIHTRRFGPADSTSELPQSLPKEPEAPKNSWELLYSLMYDRRRSDQVFKVTPHVWFIWAIVLLVLAGAPTTMPPTFSKLGSHSLETWGALVAASLVMAWLMSMVLEYPMRRALRYTRRLPLIRKSWDKRDAFFTNRSETSRVIVARLVKTGELREIGTAAVTVETCERGAIASLLAAAATLALLNTRGGSAYWYPAVLALLALLLLLLAFAAMTHANEVMANSLGEP